MNNRRGQNKNRHNYKKISEYHDKRDMREDRKKTKILLLKSELLMFHYCTRLRCIRGMYNVHKTCTCSYTKVHNLFLNTKCTQDMHM